MSLELTYLFVNKILLIFGHIFLLILTCFSLDSIVSLSSFQQVARACIVLSAFLGCATLMKGMEIRFSLSQNKETSRFQVSPLIANLIPLLLAGLVPKLLRTVLEIIKAFLH
jgi:hypothetical protein